MNLPREGGPTLRPGQQATVSEPTPFHCEHCLLAVSTMPHLSVGDFVDGRYEIERPLDAGAMGSIWLARDVHLDRRVAIKLAHANAGAFAREAATLAALRHRNIVEIYAFGMHGNLPFFVMELVDGVSAERVIDEHRARGTALSAHAATRILAQVADALGAAHARGLVHRDVKPANIVIESHTGRPVLVDFGVAIETNRRVSNVTGSPAYMAPEMTLPGELAGPLGDQYSLGATAYEMLTGLLPFDRDGIFEILAAHRRDPRPLVSAVRPELQALDAVIQRAMAVVPDQRFANSLAFARALEEAARRLNGVTEQSSEIVLSTDRAAESGSLRVLVVDDDPVALRMLARAIPLAVPGTPVKVARAATGTEAVANAMRALPQLVVLDYGLPELDGVEVLSRIRALGGGDGVRVIVASGQVGAEQRYRFSVLGVSDFLSKPYDVTTVAAAVDGLARRNGWLPALDSRSTR